uniref:Vitamin K epoxide reductase domain-containing protein n=1 Tax=Araucaria cunninghamii TaxID=56994 RepID=A0A0D6R6U2_ARACU
MAVGCAVPVPKASFFAVNSHFRTPISHNFKLSLIPNFRGVSRDPGLTSFSENIKYGHLSLSKTLPVFAVKSPEDGSTEAKTETARGMVNNSEENGKENVAKNLWYGWGTGLAALGLIETSYLTYMKATGGDVYCPVEGGNCGDVLNSSYASLFGLPLSLFGMAGYGVVAFLALQLSNRKALFGIDGDKSRWIFLGITSSMAAASAYFMYLLSVKLEGASCAYCVTSALLSLSLLLIALRDFNIREVQQVAGIQISTAALVIAALSTSYSNSTSALAGIDDIDLPPVEPVVTTQSSPVSISLAKHLRSVGAKLYGAFWCSHCYEQKQMFGAEASKILDYVECYPNGYRKGVKIAKTCEDINIKGFPTWVVKGQVLSGELEFAELARASGFDMDQSNT